MPLYSQDNMSHLCNPYLVASATGIIIPSMDYGAMCLWFTILLYFCYSCSHVEKFDIFMSTLYCISNQLSFYEHSIKIIIMIEQYRWLT